jgi:hypothetical protein
MGNGLNQITISKSIYDQLETEINNTQFENVDEYASYVFEELIYYLDETDTDIDLADQDQLKERLESLGYIQDD